MYVRMLKTLARSGGALRFRHIYELENADAAELVSKSAAEISIEPPEHIAQLLARLDEGAGEPCLFLPFVGEFGHEVMSHMRMVHFHKAETKVVCCRPGCGVLYPSADQCVTDWIDPVSDIDRIGTMRDTAYEWPDIVAGFPDHHPIRVGGLTFTQETHCIRPGERIDLHPNRRGLRADVAIGTRHRVFASEKNWGHWQRVADAIASAGHTFAVIGAKGTSQDLAGQVCNTADLDTDAAVELLQHCRLYIGTDSGSSHLASTVGAKMLVFREPRNGMRDFVPRMKLVNPGNVDYLAAGWDDPCMVIERALAHLGRGA